MEGEGGEQKKEERKEVRKEKFKKEEKKNKEEKLQIIERVWKGIYVQSNILF